MAKKVSKKGLHSLRQHKKLEAQIQAIYKKYGTEEWKWGRTVEIRALGLRERLEKHEDILAFTGGLQ